MQIVRAGERRTTTTPNGAMTTLASPTLGAASASLWSVEMFPGVAGPVHAFEGEVLWTITGGSGTVVVDGVEQSFGAGDTMVLPAGMLRQFIAGATGFTAVATTTEGVVRLADGSLAGVPAWVA